MLVTAVLLKIKTKNGKKCNGFSLTKTTRDKNDKNMTKTNKYFRPKMKTKT